MVVYFHNVSLMCLIFPSNLEGVVSDWFYSLPSPSLYNFEEITEALLTLTQYVSRREAKKNNHHRLLTVKIRSGDSLKSYIGYFQNQLAKVPNSDEDVSALAFISGLQISHPLYKHLLKHDVTRMSKVLTRVQCYIQLEESMKSSSNQSLKYESRSMKLQPKLLTRIGVNPPKTRVPASLTESTQILPERRTLLR